MLILLAIEELIYFSFFLKNLILMFSKFVSMNNFKLNKNHIKTTKYCNKILFNLKSIHKMITEMQKFILNIK